MYENEKNGYRKFNSGTLRCSDAKISRDAQGLGRIQLCDARNYSCHVFMLDFLNWSELFGLFKEAHLES